jgi:Bacterial aa3 type cytochrome c oxidase subunit IV
MRIGVAEGHLAMDYAEHARTYKMFLKLTGLVIAGVVILMACLAIFVV